MSGGTKSMVLFSGRGRRLNRVVPSGGKTDRDNKQAVVGSSPTGGAEVQMADTPRGRTVTLRRRYRKRSERPSCKTHPSDGGANHGQIIELEELADGTRRVRCEDCERVFRIGPQGQLSRDGVSLTPPLNNADRFPAVTRDTAVAVCRTPREARIRICVIFHDREVSVVMTADTALRLARKIVELAGEELGP